MSGDEENAKLCWKTFFNLLKCESDTAKISLVFSWCRTSGHTIFFFYDARVICLYAKMLKLFTKLTKIHPIVQETPCMLKHQLVMKSKPDGLLEVIKHFEGQNIRFEDQQASEILFEIYEKIQVLKSDNIKKLELLFEHSEALGININAPNEDGQTLQEIATMNEDSDILNLYKRYSKVSKKRKIAHFS